MGWIGGALLPSECAVQRAWIHTVCFWLHQEGGGVRILSASLGSAVTSRADKAWAFLSAPLSLHEIGRFLMFQ